MKTSEPVWTESVQLRVHCQWKCHISDNWNVPLCDGYSCLDRQYYYYFFLSKRKIYFAYKLFILCNSINILIIFFEKNYGWDFIIFFVQVDRRMKLGRNLSHICIEFEMVQSGSAIKLAARKLICIEHWTVTKWPTYKFCWWWHLRFLL